MKKILSVTLILTMLVCLASCTHIGDVYFYPDEFTNEYCHNNYSYFVTNNYTFSKTYRNSANGSKVEIGGHTKLCYYAIPGVDINEFVACEDVYGLGGGILGSTSIVLCRADGCEVDPINDWEISTVEICATPRANSNEIGFGKSLKNYKRFSSTSDSSLIKQFTSCIKDSSRFLAFEEEGKYPYHELIKYGSPSNSSELNYSIRIYFKNTDALTWDSDIFLHDGHYYLITDDNYIPLTEELEEYISSILQLYPPIY